MVMIIRTAHPICMYIEKKQPFIGAVYELIVEFRDDILTIFPCKYPESNLKFGVFIMTIYSRNYDSCRHVIAGLRL